MSAFKIGDPVRVWVGPPVKGDWYRGVVIGVDNRPPVRGVSIAKVPALPLRHPAATMYATHAEVEPDLESEQR